MVVSLLLENDLSRYPNPFPNRESLPLKGCVGTGDIEPPPERPLIPKPWETWADVNKRIEDANAARRQALAEALAEGKLRTPGQIKAMAIKLGCEPEEVERERLTPAMAAKVAEMVRSAAVYATAEALPYQAELAKENTPAFIAVAKVGKVLESQGVQVNTYVDKRNGGDDMGDALWFKGFQQRTNQRLAIVEGSSARDPDPDPPEDEPTEPAP